MTRAFVRMTRAFVRNLSFEVTAADVRAALATHGPVSATNLVADRERSLSKGHAFVGMLRRERATAAIEGLDGKALRGRCITVSQARPRGEGAKQGNRSRGWQVVGDGRNRG